MNIRDRLFNTIKINQWSKFLEVQNGNLIVTLLLNGIGTVPLKRGYLICMYAMQTEIETFIQTHGKIFLTELHKSFHQL